MATTAIIFIGRTEVLVFKRSREVHTEQRREERNPESGGGAFGASRGSWPLTSSSTHSGYGRGLALPSSRPRAPEAISPPSALGRLSPSLFQSLVVPRGASVWVFLFFLEYKYV